MVKTSSKSFMLVGVLYSCEWFVIKFETSIESSNDNVKEICNRN
jgi:hypothetical protein